MRKLMLSYFFNIQPSEIDRMNNRDVEIMTEYLNLYGKELAKMRSVL